MAKQLFLIVMIGAAGALGAIARFGVSRLFAWSAYPLGTLLINLSGSFFLGWFMTMAADRDISQTWKLTIGVGFVGAYTTFSTYMFESDKMLQDRAWLQAASYIAGSVFLGLLAVRLGIIFAKRA